jgi:hypothetical protein
MEDNGKPNGDDRNQGREDGHREHERKDDDRGRVVTPPRPHGTPLVNNWRS